MRPLLLLAIVVALLPGCAIYRDLEDVANNSLGLGGSSEPAIDEQGAEAIARAVSARTGYRVTAQDVLAAGAPATPVAPGGEGEAQLLWNQATAERDFKKSAELFRKIADDYPGYVGAAEARYYEGRALFLARDYPAAADALQKYMALAPVNQHLKEVERMLFEGGVRHLRRDRDGLGGIFTSDEGAITMLTYVATNFPEGNFPDDALYVIGRWYQKNRELDIATLSFKDLLIRYPDSEWIYMARLALGDAYLTRDQGRSPYHAGFVDRDPREQLPSEEAAPFAGPVKSGPELALEQYETFLQRIERDPARRYEYEPHVQYANRRVRQVRQMLADKDRNTANYYAGLGQREAAQIYRRSADAWLSGQRTLATGTSPTTVDRSLPGGAPASPGGPSGGATPAGVPAPSGPTPIPAAPLPQVQQPSWPVTSSPAQPRPTVLAPSSLPAPQPSPSPVGSPMMVPPQPPPPPPPPYGS